MTRLAGLVALSLACALVHDALATPAAAVQSPQAAQSASPDSAADEQIVRNWVARWNALGSGSTSAVDDLLTLYAADALHITGPAPHQRGTATYRGHDGIRALAATIAASQERLSYRLETETANERTAELLHVAEGPWKGASIAVQLVAVYTERESGKRWVVPAAAFFQMAGGRIRRARLYFAEGERAEVEREPAPRRRPPLR